MKMPMLKWSFAILMVLSQVCWAARPRYIIIPVEDAKWLERVHRAVPSNFPQLDRVSRTIADEEVRSSTSESEPEYFHSPYKTLHGDDNDREEAARVERQSGGGHHEHVDYGAHTGHHGAFGWHADFPVHKHSR